MNKAQLLAEFRLKADDTAGPPYAWSDERIIQWISEGQDIFCERTGFWTDKSTYGFTTMAGQRDYVLDPRIIQVNEVWDGQRRLHQYTEGDLPRYRSDSGNPLDWPLSPDYGDGIVQPSGMILQRRPDAWQTDAETEKLTLFAPPPAGIFLAMHVWRYAKVPFAVSGVLEAPPRFHQAHVHYAVAQALNDHDRERQDLVKSADHLRIFNEGCAQGAVAFDRLNGATPRVEPSQYYVV